MPWQGVEDCGIDSHNLSQPTDRIKPKWEPQAAGKVNGQSFGPILEKRSVFLGNPHFAVLPAIPPRPPSWRLFDMASPSVYNQRSGHLAEVTNQGAIGDLLWTCYAETIYEPR